MYKVEVHEAVEDIPREVTVVMNKDDLALLTEGLKKLTSVKQNPRAGTYAEAVSLMLDLEDLLEEMGDD